MLLTDSFDIPGAIQHLLRLPVAVAELGLAPGALVDDEVSGLLDGVDQVETDQDEDLRQGERLNTLRELVIVKVKLQEPMNLCNLQIKDDIP